MLRDEPPADVLILGAGPAGCAAALALLAHGVRKIVLVDRPLALPFAVGEGATPDIGRHLARLGVEADLCRFGHRAHFGHLSRWGEGPPILDHFLRRGWDHGWHLDRAAFDAWLRREATARGARLLRPATLAGIVRCADGWRVAVKDYGQVAARVVVDAAGRRAPLATRLGATRRRLDASVALAVRTAGKPSERLAGLSVVEACRDGWWYAAPLPGGDAVVMLVTDRDIAAQRRYHDPEAFAPAWQRTDEVARLVAPPAQPFKVAAFPAFSGFVSRAAGPGWIAVGDALLTLDPLTSAGIAGAFADALAAAPVILAALGGENVADAATAYGRAADAALKRYLSERRQRYNAERRWPQSPFWAKRQGLPLPAASDR
jgi:flavin-dependent dehydrogenase